MPKRSRIQQLMGSNDSTSVSVEVLRCNIWNYLPGTNSGQYDQCTNAGLHKKERRFFDNELRFHRPRLNNNHAAVCYVVLQTKNFSRNT